ncbi:hypothetical protein D3C75_484780 [compost metagenome]
MRVPDCNAVLSSHWEIESDSFMGSTPLGPTKISTASAVIFLGAHKVIRAMGSKKTEIVGCREFSAGIFVALIAADAK